MHTLWVQVATMRPTSTKHSCRLLALSLSLVAGCKAEEIATDASTQPAQPACGPLSVPCAPVDAGSAAPSTNPPVSNNNGNVPPALDAGTGTVSPVVDASPAHDAAPTVMDASAPLVDAAAPDAIVAIGDAQVNSQNDAASTADGGGSFPPVSDVSAMGPYPPKTINSTGPGGSYTIFHPAELAPNGVLSPILSWGNGGFTTPADYPQLPHFASHGFVVIASNNPIVSGQEVRAGTDWIVQQNEQSSSPFYKKLDVKRVAGVGYSNGGLAQLEAADDPRYLTLVIISGANMSDSTRAEANMRIHTPITYLCTADDASKNNCAGDFATIKQPAFFGVMNGTTHTDVTTILGLGVDAAIKRVATASTAWLRWQVMGDQSYKSWFVGADCKLCKDSNWTVMQKNLQ